MGLFFANFAFQKRRIYVFYLYIHWRGEDWVQQHQQLFINLINIDVCENMYHHDSKSVVLWQIDQQFAMLVLIKYSISIMSISKSTTSLKDFQLVCKLGEGAFAEVFKVKRKEDGLYYAMKKIRMARIKDKERNNALNQIRILASDSSENVVQYKQAFFDQVTTTLCIVMEYAQGGDLLKLIQSNAKKHTKIKEKEIWKALVHITNGLKSLHDKKILHRDLKGANIFITADGKYKIGDLNVSKVIKYDCAKTQTGTPYYASPEVWKDHPYGTKSDMWSLGCVLYEMAAQRPPFTAPDIQSLYKKICNGTFIRIPPQYSNELASIISLLLKVNPSDRPSAGALLNNPIVQDNYGDAPLNKLSWENDELLQTIKLNSRNYKEINDLLPKPKYEKEQVRQRAYSQERRLGTNIANNEQKDQITLIQKKRIKSSFEENPSSKESTTLEKSCKTRQRTISSYNPSNIVIAELLNEKLAPGLQKYPLSQKITKKLPESNSCLKTPKLESNLISQISRLPPCPSLKTPRKKVDTLVNNPLILDELGNKENLRRIGANVIGRTNTAKSISEY